MMLAGVTAFLFWLLPGFRARPVMMLSSLVLIPLGISGLLSENSEYLEPTFRIFDDSELVISEVVTGFSNGSFLALLFFGLVLLTLSYQFEKNKWTNLCTSFLGSGTALTLIGAFGSYSLERPVPPTAALILATALLVTIGNFQARRATLVTASLFATLGLVFAINAILPSTASISSIATLLAIAGIGMAGASLMIPDFLNKFNKKDENK
jgi:hypothetical protein